MILWTYWLQVVIANPPGTIYIPFWQAGPYTYSCVWIFVVIIQHFVTTPLPALPPPPTTCTLVLPNHTLYNHYRYFGWIKMSYILTGAQQFQWQQRWLMRNVQNNNAVVRGVRLSRRPVVPSSVTGRSAAAAVIYRGAPAMGAITAVAVAAIWSQTGRHDGGGTWIYPVIQTGDVCS